MLTLVGKWIATKTYLAALLSKIDFVNIPQSGLALSHATSLSRFHPHKCQKFHHVIPVEILGPLQCLRPTRAAKRLCPSASSRCPSGTPPSPDPRARCLKTADTRTDTLQYLQHILELSWLDQHVHCRLWQVTIQCVATCLSFFALAHGYPRRVPSANVKDKDETPKLPASTKTCYVDGDRDTSKILALELQGNLEEGNAT